MVSLFTSKRPECSGVLVYLERSCHRWSAQFSFFTHHSSGSHGLSKDGKLGKSVLRHWMGSGEDVKVRAIPSRQARQRLQERNHMTRGARVFARLCAHARAERRGDAAEKQGHAGVVVWKRRIWGV